METTLRLTTRRCRYELDIPHYLRPEEKIFVSTPFETITGITLPTGKTYNNRRHSHNVRLSRLMRAEKNTSESITLPDDRAQRLVSLFRRLRPGHTLECHDLFSEVLQWPDFDDWKDETDPLAPDAPIVSGAPYGVQTTFGPEDDFRQAYTHSCLGTGNGNLLGLIGKGMMLAVMTREATEELYARGGEPTLAKVALANPLNGPA